MKIAYFVNQYPKVSHTFIRREILALENLGLTVVRTALRGWDAEVSDPADVAERERTRYILRSGILPVLLIAAQETLRSPVRAVRAFMAAVNCSRRGSRSVLHHVVSAFEGMVLSRWARESGIQHVHAHFGTNSAEVAMLANVFSGLPYSFTVHGPDEWDQPAQLKIREKVQHARFVVAISHFTRAQLYRWVRLEDASKIHVVHCGLGEEYFSAPLAPLPAAGAFVCVGRLCAAKAQHLLVEALAAVRARGVDLQLVLVGDGEMRPQVEQAIAKHGLQGHVRITGWASDRVVRQELNAARALVLPSMAEGLPVALMEAMAAGRPVISTYVGGIAELVRDGRDGYMVPASDVDALGRAIETLALASAEDLQKMAESARQRVYDQHRIAVEAGKLARLLTSA